MNIEKPKRSSGISKATIPLLVGYLSLAVLIGGLGYWSVTARIAGAVVASGLIEVQSHRQVIQHPEGGVVGAILAIDGDVVEADQTLIRFDGRRQRSELKIVEGQLFEILARSSRLKAERDDLETLVFPTELSELSGTDKTIERQLIEEANLFAARRLALAQETAQLNEQVTQTENRIEGTTSQLVAMSNQLRLVGQELENQQSLFQQGLTNAARVLDLQTRQASLQGELGKLTADTAELRGEISALRVELLKLRTRRQEDAISALRELQYSEIELAERRVALLDTLSRLEVKAPLSGIIYGSQVFALQSVVQPGAPIMYVIPQGLPLVIAARVDTIHIDQIHIGQEAALRFSSFDQRWTPTILGTVRRISADVVTDEITGIAYYAVELAPKEDEMAKLGDQELLPGMPVEAFIRTGDRSPLAYLTKPLTDYFVRAFRE